MILNVSVPFISTMAFGALHNEISNNKESFWSIQNRTPEIKDNKIFIIFMLSFYHGSSHTSPTVEFNVVSSTLGKDTGLCRQKYFIRKTLKCTRTPEMVDHVVHDIQHGRGDVVK